MSNPSSDPEYVPIENFLLLPKEQQVRTHDDAEIEELAALIIQEGIDQNRKPYPGAKYPHFLTKRIRACLATKAPYTGMLIVFDGNGRFRSLRDVIGVKGLVKGVDFEIDYSINSLERLIEKSWEGNNEKGYTWLSYVKEVKLRRGTKEPFVSQDKIGRDLDIHQTTVGDYLRIANTLAEATYDPKYAPIIDEAGPERCLELCDIWGIKQWVKPTEEQRLVAGKCKYLPNATVKMGPKGEDLMEFDVGWYFLDRWTKRKIPIKSTVHDCFSQIAQGIPFNVAIGDPKKEMELRDSLPVKKRTIEERVKEYNRKATKTGGYDTLKVVSDAEMQAQLKDLDVDIALTFDPNKRIQLDLARSDIQLLMGSMRAFLKDKEHWGVGDPAATIERIFASIEGVFTRIDGILQRPKGDGSKKPEVGRASSAIDDRGIRKRFD